MFVFILVRRVSLDGARSSAWLERQIVALNVVGSNPIEHPILLLTKH